MAFIPALGMFGVVNTVTDEANWPYNDGWQFAPYRWTIEVTIEPQVHGSVETPNYQSYDGTDIKIGMWIGDITGGQSCRIVGINSQTSNTIEVIVEDVDRFNILTSDPSLSGFGGVNTGRCFIFTLN